MYLETAIERLNNIDWKNLGKERWNHENDDYVYGCDFLRRMAAFFKEHNIMKKNLPPFFFDISLYLTEGKEFGEIIFDESLIGLCNEDLRETLNNLHPGNIIAAYYLKLSALADEKPEVCTYLEVYEPIIRLYEAGGYFYYREGGMSFANSGLLILSDWYQVHINKNPVIICEEEIDKAAHIFLEKDLKYETYVIRSGIHGYMSSEIHADNEKDALEIYENTKVSLENYINTDGKYEK